VTLKGQTRDHNVLQEHTRPISKTAGDTINNSLLGGSAVGYPSDSLDSCNGGNFIKRRLNVIRSTELFYVFYKSGP